MTSAPLPPSRVLPPLEAAAQQAWQLLERRLRLLHGFGLLVYSVRTPALADALKARLAEHLRGQQRRLVVISSPHPEQFAELSLKTLLGVPESADTGAYWLEAHRGAGRALWDAERRELLLRLNERRSILEAEHHAPLILLLPAGGVADMARLAPDLWHIRLQSTELAAALPVVRPDGIDRAVEAIDQSLTPEAAAEVEAALGYWVDQWRLNFDGLSAYELRPDHPRLWDIALWDGGRALDVCLQHGRLDQASMVAQELLSVSRWRAQAESDQPLHLRDVSVSLNKVGAVAQAQGDWTGAEEAYRESLGIRRELVERLGGTPEALDDLATSMVRLATVREPADTSLLSEAATIYAALVQRCPQVTVYADRLASMQNLLDTGKNAFPDPRPDDSK